MITPDSLTEKLESSNVGFHRYGEKKNHHSLFCFMEGKHDSDYYLSPIRAICGDDVVIIDCNNKKGVLEVYDMVYKVDHIHYKLAFFIDRDFDDSVGNPNIFETDCYSIENYYCTKDVFERILFHEFHIPEDADYREDVITFFEEEFDKFHKTVDLYNAFYSLLHKYEREHNVEYNIKLGSKFPNDLAIINVGHCTRTYTLKDLLSKYNIDSDIISNEDVEAECMKLWEKNPFWAFRGKYEIEFMYKLLMFLVTNANSKDKNTPKIIKKKISTNLNGETFMIDYANFAVIPNTLRQYLSKWVYKTSSN